MVSLTIKNIYESNRVYFRTLRKLSLTFFFFALLLTARKQTGEICTYI